MKAGKLTPQELRQLVRKELVLSENGCILFDDTVIDKNHSLALEVVRRQWSGNAKEVIKGIGVVTCVYVNPDIDKFRVIDFRIFDPERDGRSKREIILPVPCWFGFGSIKPPNRPIPMFAKSSRVYSATTCVTNFVSLLFLCFLRKSYMIRVTSLLGWSPPFATITPHRCMMWSGWAGQSARAATCRHHSISMTSCSPVRRKSSPQLFSTATRSRRRMRTQQHRARQLPKPVSV
jgi:hypothetical protein